MQKNRYFQMTIIAAAILSGCSSVPQNASLAEAHDSYNAARSSTQVTNLAPVELRQAGDTLIMGDNALRHGESAASVNQLAYLAKQQVAIAQETARRKAAERDVAQAGANRDRVRLEARTAEADAANQKVSVLQETTNRQAASLMVARQDAQRDQSSLESKTAEADAANRQVTVMQATTDQQAAALADAGANAQLDRSRLESKSAEADAANRQVAVMQATTDQQAAALADASARSQRDQVLIAQQQGQLQELHAKKTERGMVITLGDVLFSTNKAQLKSNGMRNVQKLADFLKQYPQHKVLVEGYTDSTGSNSLNQALSDQRASAVRMALLDDGVDSDRVATRGYGEAFPVTGNDTAAGRQLNRRVEIILSDENGNIVSR
jgi:outer membrane protein OmpA-like peptidoglycan-associated protein